MQPPTASVPRGRRSPYASTAQLTRLGASLGSRRRAQRRRRRRTDVGLGSIRGESYTFDLSGLDGETVTFGRTDRAVALFLPFADIEDCC